MRLAWIALLAACGGDGGPPLTVRTSLPITGAAGTGMSTLEPLYMHTLELELVFKDFETVRGDSSDSEDCKSTVIASGTVDRTAFGETAAVAQIELLDRLEYWDVRLQLCVMGRSAIVLHSEIAPLNLAFGCFGVPASAMIRRDGYPQLTSFVATECSATILDVAVNRVLSNPNFSITFETGPSQLP
jgi:hypothetical protein